MIFDSHAHYDDEAFDNDRVDVINKIKNAGVCKVMNCGSSLETSVSTVKLTLEYDFIYGAVGIHPEYADSEICNTSKLPDLLENKKIKAVGEIGLDYHYEGYDRDSQIKLFKEQMDIAKNMHYPVVIHDRDAHYDTFNVIKEFKGVTGVLHCFSGSVELEREAVNLGYYIGFTGVVTFKNARRAVDVASDVPDDRLLVETDCPYMTPVPYRGERNDSSYLVHTIKKLAEIKNMEYEKVCSISYENARRLFNI